MQQQELTYTATDVTAKGFVCYPTEEKKPHPGVLVVHDWTGRNQFACDKARLLAEMGYIGFAVDMYGDARCGKSNDEKSQLMTPLTQHRDLLLQRLRAAYNALASLNGVDKQRIAIMGFCFGGLCALDLARSGAAIKATVSFHGILKAPPMPNQPIQSKILILHGYNDPMVPPEHLNDFMQEMTASKADWQAHVYGNTVHAFTNPDANDPSFGTVYNATISDRAWLAMQNFLQEVLS
jgi:dienelactone hydrolase